MPLIMLRLHANFTDNDGFTDHRNVLDDGVFLLLSSYLHFQGLSFHSYKI